jgi:hypothetical protein
MNKYHSDYKLANTKVFLCLTKLCTIKTYGRVDVLIHIFLTSALVGGEWLVSRICRFTSEESVPYTHWIGGWVSPRAGLDYVDKLNFLNLPRLSRHTDYTTATLIISWSTAKVTG